MATPAGESGIGRDSGAEPLATGHRQGRPFRDAEKTSSIVPSLGLSGESQLKGSP
jgi:hypothetical protein